MSYYMELTDKIAALQEDIEMFFDRMVLSQEREKELKEKLAEMTKEVQWLTRRIQESLGHPEPLGAHAGDPNFLCAACQWYSRSSVTKDST